MDLNAKKTALRMIPYGIYVLTARSDSGEIATATVNWVTQTAFEPPQLVVGVKVESNAHALIKQTGKFVLNMLGKGQQGTAFAFFKSVVPEGNTLAGEAFRLGESGAPILESAPAYVECTLVETIERGDHSIFVGEVIAAGLKQEIEGRPDEAILAMKDLGEKTFYGG